MKKLVSGLCMLLLCSMWAVAQSDPPAAQPAPGAQQPPGASAPDGPGVPPGAPPPGPGGPPPAPAPAPAPSTGDEIKLKNGSILKDVQVLRKSPLGLEVQASQGITFFVPRKQVVEVKYDDIEPAKQRPAAELPAQKEEGALLGEKLEPATWEKLQQPLPEACLKSDKADLVDVLTNISSLVGVKIEVSDPVRKLSAADRVCNFALPTGTTLTTLLLSDLPKQFANLAVIYKYDTVLVTTRDDPAAQEKTDAAPPADAPPAAAEQPAAPAPEAQAPAQ